MAIKVFLPAGWRRLGVDCSVWTSEATNLTELMDQLCGRWPGLQAQLTPPDISIVTLFLNGQIVHPDHWGQQTLKQGDQIDVLLPISGG